MKHRRESGFHTPHFTEASIVKTSWRPSSTVAQGQNPVQTTVGYMFRNSMKEKEGAWSSGRSWCLVFISRANVNTRYGPDSMAF